MSGAPGRESHGRPATASNERAERLRAPLLLALWTLLAVEAGGGLVIFFARLTTGTRPGEALHVAVGLALTAVYAAYQWRHWRRVAPFQLRLDYALGLIAALVMGLTNLTGLWLGVWWWRDRIAFPLAGEVRYPPWLTALHTLGSMLVLAFVGAHLGAVLSREPLCDRPGRGATAPSGSTEESS